MLTGVSDALETSAASILGAMSVLLMSQIILQLPPAWVRTSPSSPPRKLEVPGSSARLR